MNTDNSTPKQYGLKTILRVGIVLIILGALLLADLQFRGLAWQFFWSQTGEESIVGQLQGMVEVTGNLIRAQPNVANDVPIEHTDIFPYGINTFFEQEAEQDKMRVQFQMIADAGFGSIRQEFPWEDIEVDGRGQFTDTRVDYDNDGEFDTISAWDKYDNIVALAEEFNLEMIVRLSNPPAWSRAENPDTVAGALAPPDDYQDFVNYAVAVAERYQGQIQYYQVWNEPNIYPEWGEDFVSPADYTRLLCMTHDALKAVDPEIVVISGTIAPTTSIDGWNGYHDLIFIQNMYKNGAADCFDVLSAQGYGLNSGPTDRRRRATYLSYARHELYRDIMVANGDADKPIWLSEVAWSPMLDPCLQTGECIPTEQISQAFEFGAVTNEQAARYLPIAYDRAREEWSWIGHISYWHFTRPSIEQANDVMYWFRMVEADYSPVDPTFTPLPVYESAQTYLIDIRDNPVLYVGVHQAESWEISASEDAALIPIPPETDPETGEIIELVAFGEALETDSLTFIANGSNISLRLQNDVPIIVTHDDTLLMTIDANSTWQDVTIQSTLLASEGRYTLTATEAFIIDSVAIRNQFWVLVLPILCGVLAVVGAGLVLAYPYLKRLKINH